MEIKGINIIEEALNKYNGKDAAISISHKLYGAQKLRLKLDYIIDENRIGFMVKNGQEIFIKKENLVNYGIEDGIYFADDLMEIKIKLHRQ